MVYHRGRRAVPPAAAGGLVGPARGPVVGSRDHAADVRGPEGTAVPVVLRRYPAAAHALALDDPGPPEPRESPHHRTAVGLPGRRGAVVRGSARPALLDLPARRRVQPGYRRRPALPQAQ